MKNKQNILHLGSGFNKHKNSISIDANPNTKADVIHDLNKFPYPFKTNRFELIIAENIIEHLDDIVKVMEEIHRIGKDRAKVIISMAHFSSIDSFTDPTHKHSFTSRTFDYFIPGEDLYKYRYSSKAKYKKIKVVVGPEKGTGLILKILLLLINKYLIYFEKRLAYFFPVGTILYELEVIKK